MDILKKGKKLATAGKHDIVCGGGSSVPIFTSKSTQTQLLKILLSEKCSFDCKYCKNRCSKRGVSLKPEELCRLFNHLVRKGAVNGLFLSSGIEKNVDKTMEKMLRAAELVRKSGFEGYIHLKVMPGSSRYHIEEASRLADRISLNMEVPKKTYLSDLSSVKDYNTDIKRRFRWISEQDVSHTTQFIVGATQETDLSILECSNRLYKDLGTNRVYYSGFEALDDTPLADSEPIDEWRVGRLYQADFLIRKYDYRIEDLSKGLVKGMMVDEDPKVRIASEVLDGPVDPSSDPYEEIIKVPGIGEKRGKMLTNMSGISSTDELFEKGIPKKSIPFLKINGSIQSKLSNF